MILNTWEDKHTVHSYQADAEGRAYTGVIVHYMQESAWRHAEHLGFGYNDLLNASQYWVLSRICFRIHSYPRWGDNITVETWPSGMEGLFAMRDFKIWDANRKLIVEASSAWLILDVNTHRPSRTTPFNDQLELRTDRALERSPSKIILPENMAGVGELNVYESDIDVLKHVNNVRYLTWALDRLPEQYIKAGVSFAELNFMSESHSGDIIEVQRGEKDSAFVFSMVKNKDRETCRCAIIPAG